ncbi:pneumococcal serine-rich repeat protein isoform X7 [Bactrocera tryoni]|uniref:pneumococcal serine-rich repeat protein isoform X7 n=1 Tax=Bactrocera tryoni TaxID=59916 RepID=UPI001A95D3D8|nr:pneumococcal serine-rich repeat protein isoform X7 [Bactrocera tryoni]
MEVATTNTHHHNHHHHHQQHQHLGHQLHHPAHRLPMAKAQPQQQQSSLIVSAASDSATRNGNSGGSPRSPFQREVREWQRIDPDTGALLSGRLEADRWINGPLNSYGKISDSQNISQPNGTQHTQRKQLEVLQKRTANGAVQVIRAQTVQTSSSRSWSSSNSNSASTSASASASASPICMQTNAIGGRSILHNHSNSTNNHTNNNNSSKHFHSTLQQHLAEANTHWLQLSPPTIAATVDISEVSTDDDLDKAAATIAETQYIVDDGEIDDDAAGDGNGDSVGGGGGGGVDVDAVPCNYSISRSGSAGSGSGGSKGHALSSSAASSSSTLHSQSSGLLVPDTAPSLKLSNLMKSSSGGSSSSNNSTKLNTHKSAVGKVSLHAIVGSGGGGAAVGDSNNNNKTNNSGRVNNDLTESPKSIATTTKSSSGALSGTKTWQSQPQPQQQRSNARHLEQATLYGQNSNSSKTRVGVADCDDCYAVVADADEPQPRYHQHHLQTQQQLRRQQQQSGGLLSETATPTRRRDLESFRLYGDSTAASTISASATAGAATADDNAKADDLRLSTRQLRRQQQPFGQLSSNALLQRSHSISTDDLSNEWETNEAVAESNEWRRVSKLRRSFQSSSTPNNGANSNKDSAAQEPTSSIRRPYDLPASTVSVSRIRAELESGRRLTTAMRNNHVDLAALESILHGPEKSTDASKRNTLLTAESLKEIRGRLKKLSDESLYKDDFIAYQQPPSADEHIEVQQSVRRKLSTPRLRQLTPEESLEISTPTQQPSSAFKVVGATHKANDNNETLKNLNQKHTSNSLESRQKATRDTSSTEWHSRRKSYGFEKMSPPDSKTMYRMDASTDSGLGRSGELGNWSPTEAAASTAARATVIHFGEPAKTVTSAHYRAGKSPVRRTPDEDLLKRHSIAVDESQYVRDNLRKTSQVHLNGFYEPAEPAAKTTLQLSRFEDNVAECNQGLSTGSTLFQRTQNAQKRVEFCKTEVHFAAESGRVNIVETDGKPPPTNNFRRRRRTTSGPLQTLTKTASTAATTTTAVSTAAATATTASNVTHFGDDHQQRHRTIATSVVAYKASLMEPPTVLNDAQAMPATTSVTVSVQKLSDSQHAEGSRGSYASTTSGVDTTDNENDEIAAIRGILKNKPVKPKPYHLGENIDSADALWGIQLKPVSGGGSSAVGVREKEDSPTAALNKSVAERVRIVEKRHEHSAPNGYSTKINLSLDEPAALRDWPSADLPKSNIMSIELHSPQTSLDKRDSFKRNQTPPVAKPRTVSNAVSANEHPQIHVATTVKQTADRFTTAEQQRESLKIVKEARGARKLREHELSYFGVPHAHKHDDNETKPKLLPNGNSNTMSMSKRTLPSRQRLTVIGNDDTKSMRRHEANHTDRTTTNTVSETTEAQTKAQTATKWQLLNDKPDLLRHSPIAVEPQLTRRTADVQQRERNSTSVERNKRMSTKELHLEDELNDVNEADDPDEHFYENITNEITPVFKVKSPQPYDRKMDVERDAYILNEMNENADLTMKALSDEAAHKDRRRRRSSLHRRDSKPLETIEEKMHTQKTSDSFIAVKMSRGTLASEAKRHARNDKNTRVRTSSQSSVESCPRARSRSLSSEREYENIRTPKTTRTPSSAATKTQSKTTSKQQHRSSSRESQRSARLPYSSGDEVNPREEQRVRMKSKRSSNTTSGTTGRGSAERRSSNSTKKDTEKHGHHSTTTSSRDVEQRRRAASSTTHASQREERAECVTVPPQQRTASSGRSSSSKRRDDHATSNTATSGSSSGRHSSSRTATEKSRSSANAGVRLLRSLRVGRSTDDAKVSSTEHRASGHRSTSEREREKAHEKEREKESQSKSRGHSTSKTQHHSSSSEHHHRVADTNTHHLAAHSGSMSSKTREHKKSALTAVEKQHERATTPTHSKSSQVINGRHTGQHDGHRKHNDQRRVLHTRPQQNETTSTTTTHRKRSEHSARERK